jgi:hypothetical protein
VPVNAAAVDSRLARSWTLLVAAAVPVNWLTRTGTSALRLPLLA